MNARIDHLFLCLDLSSYDGACLAYAKILLRACPGIQRITLFHNIRQEYVKQLGAASELKPGELKRMVEAFCREEYVPLLPDADLAKIVITEKKKTVPAIQKQLKPLSENTLCLFGLKTSWDGSRDIPVKILSSKEFNGPVLMCPNKEASAIDRLLVGLDLKKNGADTKLVEWSNYLGNMWDFKKITGLHVQKTPQMYFPYLRDKRNTIDDQLLQKAQSGYQTLSRQVHMEDWELKLIQSATVATGLAKYYADGEDELLVVGKHSPAAITAFGMGGNTRKLLTKDLQKPIILL